MQELKKIIKKISADLKGQFKNNQKLNKEFLALSSNSINKKLVIPILKKLNQSYKKQNLNLKELKENIKKNKSLAVEQPQLYNLSIQLYMMKDQTKKRTGRHQNIKFDSEGNEYILGLNLPFVIASKKSANLFNINTFYNLVDDGIKEMREIENIIKNSDDDNQKLFQHYSNSKNTDGFIISGLTVMKQGKQINIKQLKLKNEGVNGLKINSQYTKYKINLNATKFKDILCMDYIPYIQANYRPFSCVLTCLINAFYDRFEMKDKLGKRLYKELTYSNLCKMLEVEDKQNNIEMDIETVIEKFIKKYSFLSIYIYDAFMNCIISYKGTGTFSPVSLNAMIKNKHLYQLNSNLKNLQQKVNYDDSEISTIKVSDKYNVIEKDLEPKIKELYSSSIEDIFNKITEYSKIDDYETIRIITSENMNEILLKIIADKYEPKVYFNTFLFKILIYIGNKSVFIESGDNNPIYGSRIQFSSLNEYKQIDEAYDIIYKEIIKKEYLSDIHPQVLAIENEYKIVPLVASLPNSNLNTLYETIDENKAYTECLMNIQHIPIFHYFDTYQTYKKEQIEELNYYIIEVVNDSIENQILFGSKFNRTYGFVINQLENINDIKILYYRKPLKTESVDYRTSVIYLYKKNIPIEFKKMIINKITGMLELKYNKNHLSKIFDNCDEAESYKIKYNGRIIPISKNINVEADDFDELTDDYINKIETSTETPYYLVNINSKQQLTNGLYPIKDIIYLQQRIKLFKMYKKLIKNKVEVFGFKTDCIYYKNNNIKINKLFNLNNEIGGFKLEHNKFLPSTELILLNNKLINIEDLTIPNIKSFTNEKDTKTINNFLQSKSNILIKGLYPGVGKSTLAKNYDNKALYVLPYNKLCQNIKQEGFEAITYSKAFGLFGNDEEIKIVKSFDISKYSTVVFDEALLYTPDRLKRLDILVRKHPNIKFLATGDTEQRTPIGFNNSDYLTNCMNIIFRDQILLSEIKRLSNKKDIDQWKIIKMTSSKLTYQ